MNRNRTMTNWILGLLLIAVLAVGGLFLTGATTDEGETVVAPPSATVFTGDLETTTSAIGTLQPETSATLMFGVSGQVDEVHVAVGDTVLVNETLVVLDKTASERMVNDAEQTLIIQQANLDAVYTQEIKDAEQAVEDAQAEEDGLQDNDDEEALESAETNLASAQSALDKLLPDEIQRAIDIAQAQLQQAQNALDSAEANLEATTLSAPFSGTITAIHVQAGDYATGPVVTIVDTDSLAVVLEVDEIDLRELGDEQEATITFDAFPSEQVTGEVIAIAPTATETVGSNRVTYEVRVGLDEHDLSLRSGMSAKVSLTTAERDNVVLVPNSAISADRTANKYYVTLLQGDANVRVEVTIGIRDNQYTEIKSGLTNGDTVLLNISEIPTVDLDNGPSGPFGD